MSEQENNSPRQTAVNALISWAKTGWGYYSMRDAVDNYLESCGPIVIKCGVLTSRISL